MDKNTFIFFSIMVKSFNGAIYCCDYRIWTERNNLFVLYINLFFVIDYFGCIAQITDKDGQNAGLLSGRSEGL